MGEDPKLEPDYPAYWLGATQLIPALVFAFLTWKKKGDNTSHPWQNYQGTTQG